MKQNIKLSLSAGMAAVFIGTIGLPIAVFANDTGSGSSGNHDSASTTKTEVEQETEAQNHARDLVEQFKKKAQEQNAALRDSVKQHTQEQRKNACQARKDNMAKRMTSLVNRAEKHKTAFDTIFTRVKKFHDDKQLSVANYDSLVAAVDTAQADAAAKIVALKSLQGTVDCSLTDVGQKVSAFKEAVAGVRDSLKTYRGALVDLIKAVHTAAENSTESSQ